MRLFDERQRIEHSPALMQLTRLCCVAFACLAFAVGAQDQPASSASATTPQNAGATEITPAQMPVETRKTRVLTLEEVIQLALKHNLDIQITRYAPLLDLYALKGLYGAFDPTATASVIRGSTANPSGFNPTTGLPIPAEIIDSDTYSAGVSGTLESGLNYRLSGPISRIYGNAVPFPEYQSRTPTLSLTQPVLKNMWTDNNRFQIRVAKIQIRTDEQTLRLRIMTDLTSVKSAYFNLIAARQQVQVDVQALQLAQQLVNENLKRVQVGALAPLDEKQSESQMASSKADLLAAEQVMATAENNLKALITENFTEWADIAPIPSESLVVVPEHMDLQESWRRGIAQRPEMQQARLTLEKQNVTVKYNYNQLFPEVDLTGSYGQAALDPTFTQALGDLRDGKYPSYTYGVVVTVPLGNIAPRNAYRAAKASVKQAVLQLKQEEQTVLVAIDNDVKIIQSDLQRVDATREARIYAEAALEAEQKKLENGKSTSFIVLQLQSNLTTARSAEIQAQVNYNIALEQLALDEGNTLARNHIDLQIK
jgi:outer membrane protein